MVAGPQVDPQCGVEHEYELWQRGQKLDFGHWIERVAPSEDGPIDPADPCARRLGWGGVITVDGREAEVVTPPIAVGDSLSDDLRAMSSRGRATLQNLLPPSVELRGYSTHLNCSIVDRRAVAAGRSVVERAGPALLLLLDHRASPGVLVRPRRNRLEYCGDYLEGDQLSAAGLVLSGLTLASNKRRGLRRIPAIDGRHEPSVQKFGWFVDRCSYGVDLGLVGRNGWVAPRVRAQDQLERVWVEARHALEPYVDTAALGVVDDVVDARLPLPCEEVVSETGALARPPSCEPHWPPSAPFGARLVAQTWDFALFEIDDHRRIERWLCLPRSLWGQLAKIDPVEPWLDTLPTGTRLASPKQTSKPGLFASVASVARLIPSERNERTGVPASGPPLDPNARTKRRVPNEPNQPPSHSRRVRTRRPGHQLVMAGVAAAVVVVAGLVIGSRVLLDDQEDGQETATEAASESEIAEDQSPAPGQGSEQDDPGTPTSGESDQTVDPAQATTSLSTSTTSTTEPTTTTSTIARLTAEVTATLTNVELAPGAAAVGPSPPLGSTASVPMELVDDCDGTGPCLLFLPEGLGSALSLLGFWAESSLLTFVSGVVALSPDGAGGYVYTEQLGGSCVFDDGTVITPPQGSVTIELAVAASGAISGTLSSQEIELLTTQAVGAQDYNCYGIDSTFEFAGR